MFGGEDDAVADEVEEAGDVLQAGGGEGAGTEDGGALSCAAAVRDVDAVLAARQVDRALLVGWSYGAFVAAHWISQNPDRARGAVLVDGAYPYDWHDEAMEQRVRTLFRRMGWFMPLLRPTGLTPRMTPDQMADSNIELGRIMRELGPRAGRHHRPGAVCGRFGDVLRKQG